MLYKIDNN